jgi:hypothetical protein
MLRGKSDLLLHFSDKEKEGRNTLVACFQNFLENEQVARPDG